MNTPRPIAIYKARLLDAQSNTNEVMDVVLQNGKISEIGHDLEPPENALHIDGGGLLLTPGIIDLRVKTGEPGFEYRETLQSAGRAAAAGGVTSMVIAPDTDPVIDDMALVEFIARSSQNKSVVNVLPCGGLTKGLAGVQMAEIGLMSEAGAVLFSNGDHTIASADMMRKLLSYAGAFDALVSSRCQEPSMSVNGAMHSGELSSRLGLPGIAVAAETIQISRDILLAEMTGGRLLIDQVSSGAGLELIRAAKAKGIDVSASVSVHHLTLNELDVGEYRSFAHLSPPLRSEDDRQALIGGVRDGSIDAIVSAHDPRPAEEKRLPFGESAPGACGLETILAGCLSLVHDESIDLMSVFRALTLGPADLLGLPAGRIAADAPADLILVDLDAPWVCDADQLLSKSKNTPFDGRRMQGRNMATLVGGHVVYDRNQMFKDL